MRWPSSVFRRVRRGYLAAMSSDRTESGQDPDAGPEMMQSEEDHQRVLHWTNVILGLGDPDLTTDSTNSSHCSRGTSSSDVQTSSCHNAVVDGPVRAVARRDADRSVPTG